MEDSGDYSCVCPEGFHGRDCELKTGPCQQSRSVNAPSCYPCGSVEQVSERPLMLPLSVEQVSERLLMLPLSVEQVSERPLMLPLSVEQSRSVNAPSCYPCGSVEQVSERPLMLPLSVEQVSERLLMLPLSVEQVSERPLMLPLSVEQVSERLLMLPLSVEQVSERPLMLPLSVEQVSERLLMLPLSVEQVSERPLMLPLSPCRNGGLCEDDDGFSLVLRCRCLAGFSGPRCETDLDDCLMDPCANGASCMDGVNRFSCVCPPGFSGRFCTENQDDCARWPCLHEGRCLDRADGFLCLCRPGFSGDTCQTVIRDQRNHRNHSHSDQRNHRNQSHTDHRNQSPDDEVFRVTVSERSAPPSLSRVQLSVLMVLGGGSLAAVMLTTGLLLQEPHWDLWADPKRLIPTVLLRCWGVLIRRPTAMDTYLKDSEPGPGQTSDPEDDPGVSGGQREEETERGVSVMLVSQRPLTHLPVL
ncbi:hypothetical protein NQZ68_029689 [Dissostichus eleginoides]|nr:hypothetical protein NQZ68_029689 [Dissostichus eleginoides]